MGKDLLAAAAAVAAASGRLARRPVPARAGRVVLGAWREHRLARQADLAGRIDFEALDLDLVSDLEDVLDLVDALHVDLADVQQAFLAGENLDERAELLDGDDVSLVDLADLGLEREGLDFGLRLLAADGIDARDEHGAVVLDVHLHAVRVDQAADVLAAGPDQRSDLVGRDL